MGTTGDSSMAGGATRLPARIESSRLVVRLWTLADATAVHEAVTVSEDHLRPWMPWIAAEPLTVDQRRDQMAQWIEEWDEGGSASYGIFTKALAGAPTLVGAIGLHRRIVPGGLEIGYWIHVDHVRLGYAAESAEAVTTAALAVPGIERVEIHHDRSNAASAGIPRSLGYRLVGEIPTRPQTSGEEGVSCIWRTP